MRTKLLLSLRLAAVDLLQGYLFECSLSKMNGSEPSLKKVKVEHEPDGPFGCPFCFESCRGRGRGWTRSFAGGRWEAEVRREAEEGGTLAYWVVS